MIEVYILYHVHVGVYMYEAKPVNFIIKLNHSLIPILFSLTIRVAVLHYPMHVGLVMTKLLLN